MKAFAIVLLIAIQAKAASYDQYYTNPSGPKLEATQALLSSVKNVKKPKVNKGDI